MSRHRQMTLFILSAAGLLASAMIAQLTFDDNHRAIEQHLAFTRIRKAQEEDFLRYLKANNAQLDRLIEQLLALP